MADARKTKLLVFGGNGFIGGESVAELLALNAFDITVVNRGRSNDFDSNIRVRPFVKTINIDRKSSTAVKQLRTALGDERFDAVVDFSAYNSDVVKDAMEVLEDQIKLYIYISTDSVYEVCVPTALNLSREIDSTRPTDPDEYDRLKRKDSYGHRKLKVEEYLTQLHAKSKNKRWSYVFLRLADVLGPRDSTDRWWFYQMWAQFYPSMQKPLEYSTRLSTSYVYVNDVARYIAYILSKTFLDSSTVFHNQILNLACREVGPVKDLLSLLVEELDLSDLHIPIVYNPNTEVDLFPSVTRGGIDISKALASPFHWKPTPLKQVVRETVQWYNDAYGRYPDERKEMVQQVRRTLLKSDERTYGTFVFDVNQYATQSTLKRKRDGEEVEKKILIVEHDSIRADRGDEL